MNLSAKIIVSVLTIVTIMVTASKWYEIEDEKETMLHLIEDRGEAITHIVSVFSVENLLVEDYPVLETALSAIGSNTKDVISISVTHRGKAVATYQVDSLEQGRLFVHDISIDSGSGQKETVGHIYLKLSTAAYDMEAERHINKVFWSGVQGLLVLFVSLTVLLRLIVLRRIEVLTKFSQIIATARNSSDDDNKDEKRVKHFLVRHETIFNEGSDEIGQLANSLRTMHLSITEKETQLYAAMERSDAASQAKSAFLSTMSHEIRTPMNAILGMGELLAETEIDDTQKQYLGVLRKNGAALLYLINDILDFSRVESGKIVLELAQFNLGDLVLSVVETFQLEAEGGVKIIGIVSTDVEPVRIGDSNRLRQLLMNLVGNSVKFTTDGVITIHVQNSAQQPDSLLFSISDTGIGIPASMQTAIFDVFTQGDSTTTRKYGGSGLGLTICTRLIKLMDGEIKVHSEEGKGSEFKFSAKLPQVLLAEQSAQLAKIEEQQDPGAIASDSTLGLNLLLVEDAPDNVLLFQTFIKKTGCLIDVAHNGLEAVERFKSGFYDLVVMDIQMPVMDGYVATKTIRDWEVENRRSRTPIVALTAYVMEEEVEKAFSVGCDQHLTKPIKKSVLIKLLHGYSKV
jgi:signal transduction histidine kinase